VIYKEPVFLEILALIFAVLFFGIAGAQEPPPSTIPITDDEVNTIARQMYCPVCENTPLDVCPTQACAEWRELIREKLSEGWDERQIKDFFVERFGDRVLASPPARGLNWLVYVFPPIAFLAGIFLLYKAFRSFQKPAVVSQKVDKEFPDTNLDPYLERLEEELRNQKD